MPNISLSGFDHNSGVRQLNGSTAVEFLRIERTCNPSRSATVESSSSVKISCDFFRSVLLHTRYSESIHCTLRKVELREGKQRSLKARNNGLATTNTTPAYPFGIFDVRCCLLKVKLLPICNGFIILQLRPTKVVKGCSKYQD